MKKAFEKILERLEREIAGKPTPEEYNNGINKAFSIVREVAEEYSYLSEGFDSGLLKRIADYFSSVYEGDDKTAPKMELSVYDLRYIASLNVEKCILQTEINNIKKSHEEYNNGWVPCSERLPEDDKKQYIVQKTNGLIDILGFTKDAYKLDRYDFAEYKDKKKQLFYDYDSEYGYIECECEAWQYLPEQFKERD